MKVNLDGSLSRADCDEDESLCVIVDNVRDFDGKFGYGMIKLVERQTALLRKANLVMEERLKQSKLAHEQWLWKIEKETVLRL